MPGNFKLPQTTPITASGFSPVFSYSGDLGISVAAIKITGAVSGTTPSLVVQLQGSVDGVNWYNIGSPTSAITTQASVRLVNTQVLEPNLRLAYTVTGTTPSFPVAIYILQA